MIKEITYDIDQGKKIPNHLTPKNTPVYVSLNGSSWTKAKFSHIIFSQGLWYSAIPEFSNVTSVKSQHIFRFCEIRD